MVTSQGNSHELYTMLKTVNESAMRRCEVLCVSDYKMDSSCPFHIECAFYVCDYGFRTFLLTDFYLSTRVPPVNMCSGPKQGGRSRDNSWGTFDYSSVYSGSHSSRVSSVCSFAE